MNELNLFLTVPPVDLESNSKLPSNAMVNSLEFRLRLRQLGIAAVVALIITITWLVTWQGIVWLMRDFSKAASFGF